MNEGAKTVFPKPAATVILLRDDSDGLKILLLRKALGKHFASGALVFPGGKVAKIDEIFTGDIGEKRNHFSTLKIAAIREMYEECGIALAREPNSNVLLDSETLENYKDAHNSLAFLDLAASIPLTLTTDRLIRFAHWITPPSRPKRFDTHFFVAAAPADQLPPIVDGYEIVEAQWYRPQDLINDVHAGKVKLVLPTMMNVMKLSNVDSVQEAIKMARLRNIIPVTPFRKTVRGREYLVIPEEADYGTTEISVEYLRSS